MYRPSLKTVKTVMAGLAALAIGGLASPATASAADFSPIPSAQIQVCNNGPTDKQVEIYGRNHKNEWVRGRVGSVGKNGGCRSLPGWWWKENSSIEVWWQSPGAAWAWDPYWVSEDHQGSWCTLAVPSKSNNQCR